MEHARHVLGIGDATHGEESPAGGTLVIRKMACSLVGEAQTIRLAAASRIGRAYGTEETVEQYVCSYGLNPPFRERLENGTLRITGEDTHGNVRAVERDAHPFFVATLFQPQLSSMPEHPHPLMVAFLKAAVEFRKRKSGKTPPPGIGAC